MGKIKIHEIEKKIGLTSKDVLEAVTKLKIEVKSHMSSISEEEAKQIEKDLAKRGTTKKEEKKEEKKKSKEKEKEKDVKKEEKAPVIIRREVIIAAEEEP